ARRRGRVEQATRPPLLVRRSRGKTGRGVAVGNRSAALVAVRDRRLGERRLGASAPPCRELVARQQAGGRGLALFEIGGCGGELLERAHLRRLLERVLVELV